MAKRKRVLDKLECEKKEPVELAAQTGSERDCDIKPLINNNNYTTETAQNQGFGHEEVLEDKAETQLYQPGNYKQPERDEEKARHWLFIVYRESAPGDWIAQLENTSIPFAVSEEHEFDKNPDGSDKKPHWHVIVSYNNTTTYRNVKQLRKITNGPYPIKCHHVGGAYAYFTHKWNPEKYQYPGTEIKRYNGWEKALESSDVSRIMNELSDICILDDIQEYAELIIATRTMDGDYRSVAQSHTLYFDKYVTSYRNAPVKILEKFLEQMEDDDENRDMIVGRIEYYKAKKAMEEGKL